VRPGDGVASVGYTYSCYWARLCGCQVVAEVPLGEAPRFWAAGPEARSAIFRRFRRAGARAVVSDRAPAGAAGWEPVPGTGYAILALVAQNQD
jgi:hypothetical protein